MMRHITDAHIVRAKAMLRMEQDELTRQDIPHISRAEIDRKESPVFTKPLQAVTMKQGQSAKYANNITVIYVSIFLLFTFHMLAFLFLSQIGGAL